MTDSQTLPDGEQWVTLRAKCSVTDLFELLRVGVRDDVERRNEIGRERGDRFIFKFHDHGGEDFAVTREGAKGGVVRFHRTQSAIVAASEDESLKLEATPSLGDDGVCRYKVAGALLDAWHLRRRALEDLFLFEGWSGRPF